MIVITSNEKLKQKTFIPSSSSPVETLGSTRRILSTPNYSDNCFFCDQTVNVKLYHWTNVLKKWHKS